MESDHTTFSPEDRFPKELQLNSDHALHVPFGGDFSLYSGIEYEISG